MTVLRRLAPLQVVEVVGYAVRLRRAVQATRAQLTKCDRYAGQCSTHRRERVRGMPRSAASGYLASTFRLQDGGRLVTSARGAIRIDSHPHVARTIIISGVGGDTIGDARAVAPNITICANSTDLAAGALAPAPTVKPTVPIGNNRYLGSGAGFLLGVRTLHDAVVTAGAVVVADVPYALTASGVPARSRARRSARVGSGEPTSSDR